jgi:CRP-like cAMP-binding protein
MALVDTGPRSANVRATKQSVAIPINERRFLFMVQQTPFFALRVMRVISTRLRAMNEREAPAGGEGAVAQRTDAAESGTVESSAERRASRALGAGVGR